MLEISKFRNVVIGFLKLQMDSLDLKTIVEPKICKFDICNMKFERFLLNSIKIVEK